MHKDSGGGAVGSPPKIGAIGKKRSAATDRFEMEHWFYFDQ